jgi:hypothetical protein
MTQSMDRLSETPTQDETKLSGILTISKTLG